MNRGSTSTLAAFTREPLCLSGVAARDPAAILSELSRAFERASAVQASLSLFNVALNAYFFARGDQVGPLACSVAAMPRQAGATFAVATTQQECWWRHECPPVRAVFLIVCAPGASAVSDAIAAALRRLAADPATLRDLLCARAPDAILRALARVPVDDPSRFASASHVCEA
jgi:hypothetical protein